MASVPQHHRWVWATILIVSVFFMVSNRSSDESSPANAPLRTEQDVFTRWFGDSSRFTATEHSVGSGVVFQIEEFLPPEIAATWYETLTTAWADTQNSLNDDSAFQYTTNVQGGNRKVRSNKDISKRQDEVTRFFERGAFSYSKWELAASHPVGAEMLDMVEMTMQRPDVRSLLTKMTGEKLNGIPDYFITTYAQGDFLSIHNDGNSGSMAWVINLSKDWEPQFGGNLKFTCTNGKEFVPKFNALIVFKTRPGNLPHMVAPVEHHLPRFAVTGWYMTGSDRFSKDEQLQNEMMKKRI